MKAPTFAAFAALLALYGLSDADAAISDAQVKKNCQAMTVCYRAGIKADACTISNGACPPCVTFDSSGCYTLLPTGCPFSTSYDCTDYWGSEDVTSSESSSTGSTKSASSGEAGTPITSNNTASHSSHSSASSSSAGTAGTAGSSSTEDSGSDMSVVFAIIGAAIGVIAVAVIFLTLVRRSRAAHDDEDDLAATPPALNKGAPQSTTGATTYATYNRATTANSTTGEPSLTSYYSQQPQNLPIQSPRVAGRAVPASPRVPAGRAAAVSASSQVPAPQTTPAARALPMFANKAPLSMAQQQPVAAAPVYQQAPPALQDPAARQAPSPRSRRESYEF